MQKLSKKVEDVVKKYKLSSYIDVYDMNNCSFIPPGVSKFGKVYRNRKSGIVYVWDLEFFIPFRISKDNPHTYEAVRTQNWAEFDKSECFYIKIHEFDLCVQINKELDKINEFINVIEKSYSKYDLGCNKDKNRTTIKSWLDTNK